MISGYNSVKDTLRDLLEKNGEVIDLCEYFPDMIGGVGYNELRYFSIGMNGEIEAESNNDHETEKGEDFYKSYVWEEMTDFEKIEICRLFSIIYDSPKANLSHSAKEKYGAKTDVIITCEDSLDHSKTTEGFSVKSHIGSPATLLNAGATTNITYRVGGKDLTDEEIEEINSIDSHLDRMAEIAKRGCSLSYNNIDSSVFMNNLQFLDICMSQFIADCLLTDSVGEDSSLTHCVSEVAKKNPFDYKGKNVAEFYEHKMKVLLLSAALGMTPGKEWTGRYDANGGYLVVRKDGEIVCYHFYNQNDVEDYLYNNTRFERASRGRYNFGSLYRSDDGDVYIKLNLQIRFKK